MPPMSTVRTFIHALQTKTTNTTTILEQHFARNPAGQHQLHVYLGQLQSTGPDGDFSGALPPWAKAVLNGWGISSSELVHIDSWPGKDALKELAIKAIDQNRSVHFFWELHDGGSEESPHDGDPEETDITITFRSPKWKVRAVGPDNIAVDV